MKKVTSSKSREVSEEVLDDPAEDGHLVQEVGEVKPESTKSSTITRNCESHYSTTTSHHSLISVTLLSSVSTITSAPIIIITI